MPPTRHARFIEWDSFDVETHAKVTNFGSVSGDLGTLRIRRNADCKIEAKVEQPDTRLFTLHSELLAGEVADGNDFQAEGNQHSILGTGALLDRPKITIGQSSGSKLLSKLHLLKICRSHKTSSNPGALVEWYLGGPRSVSYLPGFTERFLGGDRVERAKSGLSGEQTRDYLVLSPTNSCELTLSAVPEHFGPTWSKNYSIEYASKDVASQDLRTSIAEGIGVFFGRQLVSIGYTVFDDANTPIDEIAWNPKAASVRSIAAARDEPLWEYPLFDLQAALDGFLQLYVQHRDELSLSHVANLMNIARRTPLGADLALYSASLECLMNAWYKSKRSKSQGVYMDKRVFDDLLESPLQLAAEKLQNRAYGDRVLRRLQKAFNMGVNERIANFIEEIGLKTSASELAALQARNFSAHGRAPAEIRVALAQTRAYRTIINRVLLKVIGHDGPYTDYSTPGFPNKQLAEPSGQNTAV